MAQSEPCFVVLDVRLDTDRTHRSWLPLPGNEDAVAEAIRRGGRLVGVAMTKEGLERLMVANGGNNEPDTD